MLDVQGCAAEVSRLLPDTLKDALAAGEDTKQGARRLTEKEQKRILHPLLRLRQACCHPQVRPASDPPYNRSPCRFPTQHLLCLKSEEEKHILYPLLPLRQTCS